MTPISDPPAVGILGGTFDPIHRGHISVATQARSLLGLSRVLLVPSSVPPHRRATTASAHDRLRMVELAVEGTPGLEASDLEVARGGVSYTVETLQQLHRIAPGGRLVLLIGADVATEVHGWRRFDEICRLANIVVLSRAGIAPLDRHALDRAGIPASARVLELESPTISATDLRHSLREGLPTGDALPAAVQDYIATHHLYGS